MVNRPASTQRLLLTTQSYYWLLAYYYYMGAAATMSINPPLSTTYHERSKHLYLAC